MILLSRTTRAAASGQQPLQAPEPVFAWTRESCDRGDPIRGGQRRCPAHPEGAERSSGTSSQSTCEVTAGRVEPEQLVCERVGWWFQWEEASRGTRGPTEADRILKQAWIGLDGLGRDLSVWSFVWKSCGAPLVFCGGKKVAWRRVDGLPALYSACCPQTTLHPAARAELG